jgi:3D-(3,5/4)-trihydroxycyclohexane-1,2-dione acylhydrolase (decyclizing)
VDFAALCQGMGAHTVRAASREDLESALEAMREADRTSAVVVEVDKEMRVPGYESWWDVPVAEASEMESVRLARAEYETARTKERYF